MSTTVVINGLNYYIPAVGENNWGQNVSDALIALATATAGAAGFINQVHVSSSPITVVSGRTYLVDTSSARTLNLPAPANNAYLQVKDVTGSSPTNNITIHRFGSEQINGVAADKVLSTSKGMWTFISDGTDWFMLDEEDTQRLGRDGTVLLPFYTFGLDTDTGIYRVGADILGIATGGVVGITVNASQQLTIPKTSNQIIFGTTNTTTLSFTAPAASRTYTIPDAGGAADFVLTASAQTIAGAKTFSSPILHSDGTTALPSMSFATDPDTGVYRGAANLLGFSAGNTDVAFFATTYAQFLLPILVANGTVGNPSYSFQSDTDCGFYRIGANNLGLSIGGTKTMDFGVNTQVTSGAFQVWNGTAGAPTLSFVNDADTGFYYDGNSNVISIACGGVRKWQITPDIIAVDGTNTGGCFYSAAGAVGAPSYSFNASGATTTGMWFSAGPTLRFSIGGSEKFVMDTSNANWALNLIPTTDNARSLGVNGNRWSAVWAANGTIQTCVRSTKENIRDIAEAELKVPKGICFQRKKVIHETYEAQVVEKLTGEIQTEMREKEEAKESNELHPPIMGFEADGLPEECFAVLEDGTRSTKDVYTSAVIGMLCTAYHQLKAELEELKAAKP